MAQLRPPGVEPGVRAGRVREVAAAFWLDAMFRVTARAPWFCRLVKRPVIAGTWGVSRHIRAATTANARRILGPDISEQRACEFGKAVLSCFYDFVCDVGRSARQSRQELVRNIESIEGREHYSAARGLGKGAIIATAHMGSFEAGAAALLDREKAIHVVFKRDDTRFERLRASLRRQLGVIEAPIDDGWTLWLRLRDALRRDEVVMLQADRVMPGQKGQSVPILHGRLSLPTGPVRLALASGAPLIPVFALRAPDGRIRIQIEPAIVVEQSDLEPHPALLQFAAVLGKYIRSFGEQWLMFQPAFDEDA